jgi:methyl-accepting chemotaxis protein
MVFAIVGCTAILAAKILNAPALSVAIGAVSLLIAYAIVVNLKGTGKLRSDQAGDNCYYLGLIFTLTSLAYAIFTFDPQNTATTIVQSFGIALASTIAGLILRIFLNQSRVDLFEVEDSARLELAQAAAKLKGELASLGLDFKHFTDGLRQSVQEVQEAAKDTIDQLSTKSTTNIETLVTDVRNTLTSHSSDLAAYGTTLSKNTASIAATLGKHKVALESLSDGIGSVSVSIRDMADASQVMAKHSTELLAHTTASKETQAEALDLTIRLEKSVADFLYKIESAESSTAGLLAVVKGHNQALEAELEKSRVLVSAVHSALVDMTTSLANSLRSNHQ